MVGGSNLRANRESLEFRLSGRVYLQEGTNRPSDTLDVKKTRRKKAGLTEGRTKEPCLNNGKQSKAGRIKVCGGERGSDEANEPRI